MDFTCKKCGSNEYTIKSRPNGTGTATGLYCAKCGFWHKWLSKRERNQSVDATMLKSGGVTYFNEKTGKMENVTDKVVLELFGKVEQLEKENAELKQRLEKAVELPCKVGDEVYFVLPTETDYIISMGICERIYYDTFICNETRVWVNFKDNSGVYPYTIGGENLNYIFKTREQAEQRLAELKDKE